MPTNPGEALGGEVLVTPEMVEAGMEELRDHHYGDDIRYILECVYRAMAYESASA
ncbi:hypothetical protein [Sphingobium baderi]|uniref:Uncharacterized protein n=1 Tax=Sphingobium baderi LL03 TaxID=1114964 RepID=T0I3J6_9SPHN|nr:hypothetical protein [Sphingobium baderi]EQB06210.1 hypothetical protein L485_00855 [Sphingobium baderi LL03]KMS62786.1 hypothetical protein V475_06335 [Sphingobium baderi LL03]